MVTSEYTLPVELISRIDQLALQAPRPAALTAADAEKYRLRIKELLKQRNAQIIAHFYVDEQLQALAEETGGFVADSLDMANFGSQSDADVLVVLGVKFMGETAKMLSPEKTVIMPDLAATCSLDVGCPADEFAEFCAKYPDRKVVVYANTSAEVKAIADWVVTSSNALQIVTHLKEQGEKIIWGPDQHLGAWIEQETGIDMIRWMGHCIVHDEFKAHELAELKQQHPDAKVLVHPESMAQVIELADVVGSTKKLIEAATTLPDKKFIVATDYGIFYKMRQLAPGKELIVAPTNSQAMQCVSCAHCPWMAMNGLANLAQVLETLENQIELEESVRVKALESTQRMLDFSRKNGITKKIIV